MANRVTHGTTVGGTATPVVLANIYTQVEVINRGGGDLFVRTDGTAAVVGADENDVVPANSAAVFPVYTNSQWTQGEGKRPANTTISIISSAAVTFTVAGTG